MGFLAAFTVIAGEKVMLEKSTEYWLRDQLKTRFAMCLKLEPTVAGIPDRLVICPWGAVVWLELKQEHGRVRRVQSAMHERLRKLGQDVRVIYGQQGAREFIHWFDLMAECRKQTGEYNTPEYHLPIPGVKGGDLNDIHPI